MLSALPTHLMISVRGGCLARMERHELTALVGVSERDGEYVIISGIELKKRSRSLGTPHRLDLGLGSFATIFSVRFHDDEHINLREARAVVHYLKWVL